ncbi:Mobile element protein [Candidatus Enterovibrio escicola]|uniref:Mobile element protein n=2 Tax=Candidatus Enterovibrio escicola TaxID=1927127 RepID=A0A2A5T7U7_9GAMM|nr:Mobile element protein [Candidatus Enterovibrio escacola]
MMTIVIAFHQSGYRDFKTYYIHFFAATSLSIKQSLYGLPSLICPNDKFITTYTFSNIKFIKV